MPGTDPQPAGQSRRTLLKTTATLLGGAAAAELAVGVAGPTPAAAQTSRPARGPSVLAGDGIAVAPTTAGPVIGYVRHGVFTFKGVPYGTPTGGANRYRAPKPPAPWTAVRSSRHWGPVAPQNARGDGRDNDEVSFIFDWNDATARVYAAGQGEDCLVLNVWTPDASTKKKRPVLFWLHGGGWTNGSAHEHPAYDGENLARRGDVVVVSVHHRLGPLGFLDLGDFGPDYADSANAGLLDIVLALQWVRDNVAAFGGDPACVTVFGQSGGGAKVSALMGMPAARGLFHRAIVQSGSLFQALPPAQSRRLAAQVVAELGLDRSSIARIHDLPFEAVLKATDAVMKRPAAATSPATSSATRPAGRPGFGPTLDGVTIPAHPFDPRASDLSADVPMLVGCTVTEFTSSMSHPELEAMTPEELERRVRAAHAEKADRVLAAYRAALPGASPFELWAQISAAGSRRNAVRQCSAKAALGRAAAYCYWFAWRTPLLDGRPRAFHCAEIPFVFDNTDRCDTMTGGGDAAADLAGRMADAWVAFARTGDPNHAGLPRWTPFTDAAPATMVFDHACVCSADLDAERRRSLE